MLIVFHFPFQQTRVLIPIYPIFSSSGSTPTQDLIPVIAASDIFLRPEIELGGDAPKHVAHIFEHGQRSQPNLWPLYVIKTPQYRHPIEAIYEHLFSRLGRIIGIETAETKLAFINGQVRLLSKFFLEKEDELVLGTDLFGRQLGSREAALKIEFDKISRQVFTVQKTMQVFENEQLSSVSDRFVRMLFFDALVGHTDRNLTNWGVITAPNQAPKFAPVFDTVRGMMLNFSDERLAQIRENPRSARQFWESQLGSVLPKIGWGSAPNGNHIALITELSKSDMKPSQNWLDKFIHPTTEAAATEVLQLEFAPLLTEIRLWAIQTCLQKRWQALRSNIQ